MAAPSIKDVAKLAGVSPSTVSLVINGNPAIKPETAFKVRQAVEQLHYVPNQAARSLVTREKKVISVIQIVNSSVERTSGNLFHSVVDTLTQDVFKGAQSVLAANGYSLLMEIVDLSISLNEIDIFDRSRIDGAIFIGGMITDSFCKIVKQSFIPAVYAFSRHLDADFVDSDPEEGMYLATRHLIQQGHTRIALINGSTFSQSSCLKLEGYKRALEETGLFPDERLIRNAEFNGQSGYEAMKDIWAQAVKPTAVIGGADSITLGAYRYLYSRGIHCPADISIVGYETSILTAYCSPQITSICLDRQRIGAEAAQILINRIRNYKAKPVHMIIPPYLCPGESVRGV